MAGCTTTVSWGSGFLKVVKNVFTTKLEASRRQAVNSYSDKSLIELAFDGGLLSDTLLVKREKWLNQGQWEGNALGLI